MGHACCYRFYHLLLLLLVRQCEEDPVECEAHSCSAENISSSRLRSTKLTATEVLSPTYGK